MPTEEARHQKLRLIAEALTELRDDEILEVLRLTFDIRTPFPGEAAMHQSRYFLGLASFVLEDKSNLEEGRALWNEREVLAAANPDVNEYGTWQGPDYGFAQQGECEGCHISYRRTRLG